MKERKKVPCKYCGSLGFGTCDHCNKKLVLWRTIQTMVRNKIKEVRGKNGKGKR